MHCCSKFADVEERRKTELIAAENRRIAELSAAKEKRKSDLSKAEMKRKEDLDALEELKEKPKVSTEAMLEETITSFSTIASQWKDILAVKDAEIKRLNSLLPFSSTQ